MWQKDDSKTKMNWLESLNYADNLKSAGHDDWRLPNAKELQSIVAYTHAPDSTSSAARGPAIDHIFNITSQESYFWTSSSHPEHRACGAAAYVAFGWAMGGQCTASRWTFTAREPSAAIQNPAIRLERRPRTAGR